MSDTQEEKARQAMRPWAKDCLQTAEAERGKNSPLELPEGRKWGPANTPISAQ